MDIAAKAAAEPRLPSVRRLAAAALLLTMAAAAAQAQTNGLTIYPVTIRLAPGEMAAVLTVQNHTDSETTLQVRAFSWSQPNGSAQLVPTDSLLVSPPIGTIAAGQSQVVRLVLRRPAQDRESTYRILLDQIPPPAKPGTVNFALRLSIPVFVEPPTRVAPHLQWSVEGSDLVAVNDGTSHETVRDISISTAGGQQLKIEQNVSPYVLAGAARRWKILTPGSGISRDTLRLKAQTESGAVDQAIAVRNVQP